MGTRSQPMRLGGGEDEAGLAVERAAAGDAGRGDLRRFQAAPRKQLPDRVQNTADHVCMPGFVVGIEPNLVR